MKAIPILILTVILTGCATSLGTGARDYATSRAAEAYDESLHNAELWVCRGASAGSVIRRYGVSEDYWAAWLKLCRYSGDTLSRPVTDDSPTTP